MGLDIGEKRIGVALSDPTGTVSQPFTVIQRTSTAYAVEKIAELAVSEGVDTVVVGCPVRTDGTKGPEYRRVLKFCGQLKEAFGAGAPEMILWDERYTTVSAQRSLIEGGVRREKRTGVVDKVAASIMLQSYLDGQRGGSASERT